MNKEITLEYLLELYKNKNYDEIIKQADKCLDPSSMFLKAFSYLYLGRVYDGYDYVVLNKEKMCYFSINSYLKLYTKILMSIGYDVDEIADEINKLKKYENNSNSIEKFIDQLPIFYEENIEEFNQDYVYNQTLIDIEELKSFLDRKQFIDAVNAFTRVNKNSKNIELIRETLINYIIENPIADFMFAAAFEKLAYLKETRKFIFKIEDSIFNLAPIDLEKSLNEHYYIINKEIEEIDNFIKDFYIADFVKFLLFSSSFIVFPNYMSNYENCVYYLNAVLLFASEIFNVDLTKNYLYRSNIKLKEKEEKMLKKIEKYFAYIGQNEDQK